MRIAVIGAGASGLVSAYFSAERGNDVTVFEKNEKCGKKLYITGKGRCNLTNDIEPDDFLAHVVNGAKFLTGAVYRFSPRDTIEFFESGGLRLKKERGSRMFPASDKASDVTKCLERYCAGAGVKFLLNREVTDVSVSEGRVSGVVSDGESIPFDRVIVATGGRSYPATGSTGDGYRFAASTGHTVVQPVPSLCGLNLEGDYFEKMQGLSLKNVELSVYGEGSFLGSFFGEMLFTHYGVSGPVVLSASALINRLDLRKTRLRLDFKPALDDDRLDRRILRDFGESPNKTVANCLKTLLPAAAIPEVLIRTGLTQDRKVNSVTREERGQLLTAMKKFDMIVKSLRGFEEAVVTSGGVDLKEINPKTMESKIVSGLYFCGEVLDCDAYTGGYNLQIAFSTGYAAGNAE